MSVAHAVLFAVCVAAYVQQRISSEQAAAAAAASPAAADTVTSLDQRH